MHSPFSRKNKQIAISLSYEKLVFNLFSRLFCQFFLGALSESKSVVEKVVVGNVAFLARVRCVNASNGSIIGNTRRPDVKEPHGAICGHGASTLAVLET